MKEGVREGLRDISCPLSLSDLPRSLSPADERRPGGQGCWQLAWPRQPSAPSQKYRVVRTASCDRQIHARMCAGEHQRQSLCASMCAHIVSRERACRDRVRERERERESEGEGEKKRERKDHLRPPVTRLTSRLTASLSCCTVRTTNCCRRCCSPRPPAPPVLRDATGLVRDAADTWAWRSKTAVLAPFAIIGRPRRWRPRVLSPRIFALAFERALACSLA